MITCSIEYRNSNYCPVKGMLWGNTMELLTILFIAVGLAMDAFAVSVSNGVAVKNFRPAHGIKQGIYFGGFQFLMPVIGWFLGSSVKEYIEAIDHWIAFVVLAIIGANMVLESFHKEQAELCRKGAAAKECLTAGRLMVQAIATSIDALAVGISFAILDVNILSASAMIGIIAFLFSYFGGILGIKLGELIEHRAEFLGGIILILIGLKILLEHLFA